MEICLSFLNIDKGNYSLYYLKHQEGGLQAVCEVMERYEKKAVTEANVKAIRKMISEYHATKESILEDYTEEEYSMALNELAEQHL